MEGEDKKMENKGNRKGEGNERGGRRGMETIFLSAAPC